MAETNSCYGHEPVSPAARAVGNKAVLGQGCLPRGKVFLLRHQGSGPIPIFWENGQSVHRLIVLSSFPKDLHDLARIHPRPPEGSHRRPLTHRAPITLTPVENSLSLENTALASQKEPPRLLSPQRLLNASLTAKTRPTSGWEFSAVNGNSPCTDRGKETSGFSSVPKTLTGWNFSIRPTEGGHTSAPQESKLPHTPEL